ncbi:MAG: molecular chaperone DnaJ, partial [Cyanobacteria bacterium P01_A01_bin.45]
IRVEEQAIESKSASNPPNTLEVEERLKWTTYEQLQDFLKKRRFPQAIALAEALAHRLPHDSEIRQWQAISYQLWGRMLIKNKQFLKARIYLKKALKTDPNNKSLTNQVQQDLQRLQ